MRRELLICLLLSSITLALYWQALNFEFVYLDDTTYVTENSHVQEGLTAGSITWAFTTTYAVNWHPLTWLSHMLDCQLYGLNPSGHHVTSVLLHMANAVLLFLVLNRMTGGLWRSACVAALFALHPLHVESVAWVSERKDVLSTFFWILTMWMYLRYVERPRFTRYILALFIFALGLMAKPMLVTLPFVLLLLDYWPLERFRLRQPGGNTPTTTGTFAEQGKPLLRLLVEKVPFFALTAASSIVTFVVQRSGGAVTALEVYPIKIRIANGLVSYVSYIGKMIWPHGLVVFYLHPGKSLPVWHAVGAGVLLACISFAVIRAAQRHPYLAVGWLWYVGTLVPVIGLVQVGIQAMADRYTYVPLIGLFIIIAWGIPELAAKWRYRRSGLALAAGAVLAASMILTWTQLHHWKNTFTLFEHALDVRNDYLAHGNLGNAYARQGRFEKAATHFSEALKINPDFSGAHNNLGNILARQGRIDEAKFHFSRAQQLEPDFAEAYFNLGDLLARQGNRDEALVQFSRALELSPEFVEAHNSLGVILAQKGNLDEAIFHFREALRLRPGFLKAQNNLAIALQEMRKLDQARKNTKNP